MKVELYNSREIKPWPSRDILRAFRGNFGGIIVPELQFGFPNKVLFTPGYVVENAQVRQVIRSRYKDSGFAHFPINTYNDTSIYHDVYPSWNDGLINTYLEELLNDDIIPVCSLFPDNVKTIKGNASPDLVPIGFTGWENPSPIINPAQDRDNLFYVAKQSYPKALIYWHNPSFQGAPFVNNAAWGHGPNDEFNSEIWDYMVYSSGCQGLLNQGAAWENLSGSIGRLNDFKVRLIDGQDFWPKADLIDFEETVYYLTTMQGDSAQALAWTKEIRDKNPGITGYCNG